MGHQVDKKQSIVGAFIEKERERWSVPILRTGPIERKYAIDQCPLHHVELGNRSCDVCGNSFCWYCGEMLRGDSCKCGGPTHDPTIAPPGTRFPEGVITAGPKIIGFNRDEAYEKAKIETPRLRLEKQEMFVLDESELIKTMLMPVFEIDGSFRCMYCDGRIDCDDTVVITHGLKDRYICRTCSGR